MESAAVLNIPNLALKIKSSYLTNRTISNLVRYNSLFRESSEKVESPLQDELTDEYLLTLLIRCVFRNTKQDRDLLKSVKTVKTVIKSQYQDLT